MKLYLRNGFIEKSEPLVMGILNVTPDSFSDAGRFLAPDAALAHAREMAAAGADIIDVGGESTRPGASRVGVDEETDRVLPLIARIKEETGALVSIDTSKEEVARLAVEEGGADIVNDISALGFSERMAATVAAAERAGGADAHPRHAGTMQKHPVYADVVAEIFDYFQERIDYALSHGIKKEKIILDPGIGFGKRLEDNIAIIRHLRALRRVRPAAAGGAVAQGVPRPDRRREGPRKARGRDPRRQPGRRAQRRRHPARPRRGRHRQGAAGLAPPDRTGMMRQRPWRRHDEKTADLHADRSPGMRAAPHRCRPVPRPGRPLPRLDGWSATGKRSRSGPTTSTSTSTAPPRTSWPAASSAWPCRTTSMPGKQSLTAEIYFHGTPENAFAIYASEKPLAGDYLTLGSEG